MGDERNEHHPPTAPGPLQSPAEGISARQAYNIVADTVGGPNLRLKDNLYQGLAILGFAILGGVIGLGLADEPLAGLIVGAIIGMVAGLFASGLFLMLYRSVRHLRGRHD